ncbi:cytochrome c oxidase assembly factor 3, mitochondrial [Homalodisca vitripennis]|uniref:cytochrome c oxidase assembly factor 3, mitochondrial n=1 Tax=Homalodisca vitripennis TaxID=197043 RepID=UPI001EEBFA7B|nr:cytochrome c oxidase assembly factor 3, mitochondrial [Homalodisca vitripennis]XP_046659656.1 cytochrome c oxidase assembly factor 3, mitochondrial [Homalodisca vitripennis]KAG8243567.1 Dimethyladenosine transferase 1, mitochondrial [Homalodisca vitripennis]
MADNDQMPKVDLTKDKKLIDAATKEWMKYIEKENLERVQKLKVVRRKNLITGLLLGTAVIGIYSYSILTVKQETFLDDFEEPKLVKETSKLNQ